MSPLLFALSRTFQTLFQPEPVKNLDLHLVYDNASQKGEYKVGNYRKIGGVTSIAQFFTVLVMTGLSACAQVLNDRTTTSVSKHNQVAYKTPEGDIIWLQADADDDKDGITNRLELEGYTYTPLDGLEACNPDTYPDCHLTDPRSWSTDQDPYSDYMEVTGINLPATVPQPYNRPLIAANPIIGVELHDYDVIPIGTITKSNGQTISNTWSNTTSSSNTVGGKVTTEASLNPFKMLKVAVESSYSHTWGQSQTIGGGTTDSWSEATSTNPGAAARLRLSVAFINQGGCPAREVRPTFNLILGDRIIATIKPELAAIELTPIGTPSSRFPRSGSVAVEHDAAGREITVSVDELVSIQQGVPLFLDVVQVEAKVVRWNEQTQSWDFDVNWSSFENNIISTSTNLMARYSQRLNYSYPMFTSTDFYRTGFTIGDLFDSVFVLEQQEDSFTLNGKRFPGEIYIMTDDERILESWEQGGETPEALLQVPAQRSSQLIVGDVQQSPPEINVLITKKTGVFELQVTIDPQEFNFPVVQAKGALHCSHCSGQPYSHFDQSLQRQAGRYITLIENNEPPYSGGVYMNGELIIEDILGNRFSEPLRYPD